MSLCYLAMGAVDICTFEKLKCWDVAAGILIIQEAEGIVLDLYGKHIKYNMYLIHIYLYSYLLYIFRKSI